jgi:hypothetical protein
MPLRMGWLAALRTPLLRQGDQGEAEGLKAKPWRRLIIGPLALPPEVLEPIRR